MERIMALVGIGEVRAAERRVNELRGRSGISGHDQQIALRAIARTKERLAAEKAVAAEATRAAPPARKQKKRKKSSSPRGEGTAPA